MTRDVPQTHQRHPHASNAGAVAGTRRKRRRRAPQGRRRPQKKTSALAWFGIVIAAMLVAVIAGVGVFLATQSPGALLRDRLIAEVEQATGRTLTIAGEPSLGFWPSLAVSMDDVRLSPPPGMQAPDTLTADRLSVSVAAWPLISGEAVVEGVTLVRPVFDLRTDRNGRTSWDFASAGELNLRPWVRLAQAGGGIPARPSDLGLVEQLRLKSVSIVDGEVNYSDARSRTSEQVTGIDLTLKGETIRDPARLAGDLTVRGLPLTIDASVDEPAALIEGRTADVTLNARSQGLRAAINGKLALARGLAFAGPVSIDAESIDRAVRVANVALPNTRPLGRATVAGDLTLSEAAAELVRLQNARIGLGDMKASGEVGVSVNAARPRIRARLALSSVDVDRLLAAFEGGGAAPSRADAQDGRRPPTSTGRGDDDPISQLLRRSEGGTGQVRGFKQGRGWSDAPIDLAAMRMIDVNADITSGPIRARGLTIDKADTDIVLRNGAARIQLNQVALYQGTATGVITASAAAAGAKLGVDATLKGIAVRPFLKDLADVEDLAGTGDIRVNVRGAGRSQRAIASALEGDAGLEFRNGSVVGWNIAELIRGLQRGDLGGLNRSPTQQTDFSALNATFQIAKGVARNNDLSLVSPLLRVGGAGTIDIGKQRLNYTARPNLVTDLRGQGADAASGGFEIPVKITGSWHDPNVRPDVNVSGEAVNQTISSVKEKFKGKKTGEIVDELLRDDGKAAKDILKGLFGR